MYDYICEVFLEIEGLANFSIFYEFTHQLTWLNHKDKINNRTFLT